MTDQALVAAFEDCTLPAAELDHRAHVRLAWHYLRHYQPELAVLRITDGIRRFAAAQGAGAKYHETITQAWIRLVAAALAGSPAREFAQFLAAHPQLLDRGLLARHYSDDLLASELARRTFVAPDRAGFYSSAVTASSAASTA